MEDAPIAEIRPNVKKAFISNIFFVSLIVALIIGTLIYLNSLVGLSIFLDTFKDFGIIISPSVLLFWFIMIIIVFTALLLIMDYINLGKITYTLYPDRINYGRSLFIMQLSDKVIPYANIAKISFGEMTFLKTAKVRLDLTGMKGSSIDIDYIDNPQEVVEEIHRLVGEYKSKYYARYSQDYRYQNIMDEL